MAPVVAGGAEVSALVVFQTTASLDPLDTNSFIMDIYLRRTATNTTVVLSRGQSGGMLVASNGASFDAAISGDGNFVAFTSAATNLVTGDTNARQDVFLVGTSGNDFATRVSVNNAGAQSTTTNFTTAGGSGLGVGKVVSFDGNLVLFHGAPCDWDPGPADCATVNCLCADSDGNCSPCTMPVQQVYLRDLVLGQTFRVSRVFNPATGTFAPGNATSRRASLDPGATQGGGSLAATWSSTATNFVDMDATEDVFTSGASCNVPCSASVQYNTGNATADPARVSVPVGGGASNGQSTAPMLNSGASFVIFESVATNLLPAGVDTNGLRDIFAVFLGDGGTVFRLNTSSSGAQAVGGASKNPDITIDCVNTPDSVNPNLLNCDFIYVYESAASNLDPLDGNVIQDPYEGLSRSFIRGDATEDGMVNVLDKDFIEAAFQGMETLSCLDAADVNDDGSVNTTDILFLNNFLFFGGPPPPAPFSGCGKDPTTDGLSCDRYALNPPCTQ